jgi:ppGpp synthetase/RelA/SpoT-type nucleotidyltranferase
LKEVTDLAGIRVICYVEADVQRVCKIIEAAFTVDPSNSSDKARGLGTDRVGYRSVHFVARFTDERLALPEYRRFHDLLFEIQVRTIRNCSTHPCMDITIEFFIVFLLLNVDLILG